MRYEITRVANFLVGSIITCMSSVNPRPLAEILAAMSNKTDADVALVTKAYEFSKNAHKDQKRYSGDNYFVHPAEVGFLLATAGMDSQTIAAGFLHDTIEDAGAKPQVIEEQFGPEVLSLVIGVTKLGTLRYRGLERHTESLRKLFAATAKDIRVLIIKLMDRLHNARTLEHVPVHILHPLNLRDAEGVLFDDEFRGVVRLVSLLNGL